MMPESFDLVIFDCDGVLVDSEVLSCRCLAEILGEHGMTITADEVLQRFLGRSSAAVADYFEEQTGRPLPATFRAALNRRLATAFAASLELIPGALTVLQNIGERYCLATSSDPERIEMTLRITRLAPFFDRRVFTASMVANGKPAPDLFLLAATQMNAAPGRTLVVEDSVNGVLAGKRAGMTVWGFTGGSHYASRDGDRLLAEAGADRTFHSLDELMLV